MNRLVPAYLLVATIAVTGCIKAQPPTDTGDIGSATSPTAPSGPGTPPPTSTAGPFSYDQDLKAIFASDCVLCHGGVRVDGNYRMNTYADVMRGVAPGNAASTLVRVTQSNGSMYRYWSGSSRAAKANMVYQWVVTYKAQQTR